MSLLRLTTAALVLGLTLNPVTAQDIQFDHQLALQKAERAFLHLKVTGTLAGESTETSRDGKAFAIGPDLLLTSSHVLGDWSEWEPQTEGDQVVIRALRPVKRRMSLTWAPDLQPLEVATIVMPTFAPMIDATTLRAPKLGLKPGDTFQLSLCDIQVNKTYFALVTLSETPSDPTSIREPGIIELVAESYQPEKFGGLYVFRRESDDGLKIDDSKWGHDGAPILAADGTVVALISAVVVEGADDLILATPVQSLIPGTSALLTSDPSLELNILARPKCSMVDLVDRMARNLDWSIEPLQVEGVETDQLVFSYESVTQPPAFDEIEVRASFFGRDEEEKYTRLFVDGINTSGGRLVIRRESFDESKTKFLLDEIVSTGKELMQRPGSPKPVVTSVEITIVPLLARVEPDGSITKVPSTIKELVKIDWADLKGAGNAG